jgi:seryl-tRNA synthetase
MKTLGETIKAHEEEYNKIQDEFHKLHSQVPNVAHPDSPIG